MVVIPVGVLPDTVAKIPKTHHLSEPLEDEGFVYINKENPSLKKNSNLELANSTPSRSFSIATK